MTADQEYATGVRAAALIIAVLCGLCLLASLSGCASPQKLIAMSRRALVLTKGAEARCKDVKSCAVVTPCAEASARAATESEKALRKQADAVRVTDGARADEADRALRSAERECAK